MELVLKNVSKNYGENEILKKIDLKLTTGVYGVLGANGAGKTTLFRIICGLMKPSSGEVLYNSQSIMKHPESYRNVLGFLPQDFRYYPDFSGLKFLLYIAGLKGLSNANGKKKCLELINLVGLSEVKNKKIKNYSGGMKQRLGIAQSLINEPEVLILDEPTVGLDPKERVRFRNLISSLSANKIVILSTHIVSDIEYIADEILILNRGIVVNKGTAKELVKLIQGKVWEIIVPEYELNKIAEKVTISNQRYSDKGTIVRVVSETPPTTEALQVPPNLEDLYLYYFKEVEQNEDFLF